jgi:hypothetical protein
MTDTRHLDTAISILSGTACSKRAKRTGTEVSVYLQDGGYSIQVNHKPLVCSYPGTKEEAMADAEQRAKRLRALTGKPVTIQLYE